MYSSFWCFQFLLFAKFLTAYFVKNKHIVSVGEAAQLRCADNVTETSIAIIWKHNGQTILYHDLKNKQISSGKFMSRVTETWSTVILVISSVSLTDCGKYSCIWYLPSGVPQRKHITLNVQGYPSLSLHRNTSFVGDDLVATCCVEFGPSTTDQKITWFLQKENVSQFASRNTSESIRTSTYSKVTCSTFKDQSSRHHNKKDLQCLIQNELNLSSTVTLDILYPATVDVSDNLRGSALSVELGSFLNITCVGEGNPLPNVTLQRVDGSSTWRKTSFKSKTFKEDAKLRVITFYSLKVTMNDKGYYRCFAQNTELKFDTERFFIDVILPLKIQMLMPPIMKIEQGEELVISCQTEGNPEPKVQLQRNHQGSYWKYLSIKPIPIFKQDMISTWMFRLTDHNMDLIGKFRCIGYNGVGDHVITTEVVVEEQSGFSQHKAKISFPRTAVAVLLTVLITCLTGALISFGRTLCRKTTNRSKRARSCTSPTSKDIYVTQDNAEVYDNIRDDNFVNVANHIDTFTSKDVQFISKLKCGRHMERWLGLLKKTAFPNTDISVCILVLSGKEKKSLQLWNRHLYYVIRLPRNENVVTTLGTFEDNGIVYCIQEYLPFGSLRAFLETKFGQDNIYNNTLEPIPQEFVFFALDVVKGMEFLRYHGWIHPGLCAKKVLFDNKRKRCKLYDFCHTLNKTDKIKLILSVKTKTDLLHVAPETIDRSEYSSESDTWSLGVLLWEICSYGATVPAKTGKECHADIHRKLAQPSNCPRQLYDVMTQCWGLDPTLRPTFQDLEKCLEKAIRTDQMSLVDKGFQETQAVTKQDSYATEIHSY